MGRVAMTSGLLIMVKEQNTSRFARVLEGYDKVEHLVREGFFRR